MAGSHMESLRVSAPVRQLSGQMRTLAERLFFVSSPSFRNPPKWVVFIAIPLESGKHGCPKSRTLEGSFVGGLDLVNDTPRFEWIWARFPGVRQGSSCVCFSGPSEYPQERLVRSKPVAGASLGVLGNGPGPHHLL